MTVTKAVRRFPMKVGDLEPPLQFQIFGPDGKPRDMSTGITSVLFYMGKPGEAKKINGVACDPVLPANGIYQYAWRAGDTDEPGDFRATVKINGEDTFPKSGYILVALEEGV